MPMPYFFNSNQTGFCQTNEVISKISNLTASYAARNDGGQELMAMVSGPIIMFILIALFLRGTFDARAVLGPNFRLLLSSALALFLPVMSYLFSEAKDAAGSGGGGGGGRAAASDDDLSVRARVILTWMLLVELLRKKVDEMRMWGSYSSSIQRAGRVVWLGSLVYFNITSPGRKAVFSVLWILCATKLLQRIVFTEVEKRSYPDKSWLISSYMAEILKVEVEAEPPPEDDGSTAGDVLMKTCNYIVMGEEKLVGDVTADGYNLNINAALAADSGIITVGKIWRLAETDDRNTSSSIRRVCLSFALFKLLRRRFEHLPPMTDKEGYYCRGLVLTGLLRDDDREVFGALFSVMADEVKFLSEYYHSVVPVVLASPLFILVNYFLLPALVFLICLIAVVVCGSGDVSHALSSMSADNYVLQPGFAKLAVCVVARAVHSRPAFLFILDLLITLLLFIILFFDEIWEFLTVLISNWFIISMVCNYMINKQHWRLSARLISSTFRWTLWLRRKMSRYTDIRLKQFSLLSNHSGPRLLAALVPGTLYMNVKSVPMTTYLKLSIGKCLSGHCASDMRWSSLLYHVPSQFRRPLKERSVTEVILILHIATCILEERIVSGIEAEAAIALSRYCAYLVVFHPELLPDRRAKAELVLKETKQALRNLLGFWRYYLGTPGVRALKLMEMARIYKTDSVIESGELNLDFVTEGVKLASDLFCLHEYHNSSAACWQLLTDVWTELLVYAAPAAASVDEERVKAGHADVLVEGVELITVLWAFAMHTGMERQTRDSTLLSS